jgi:hypothetical protein
MARFVPVGMKARQDSRWKLRRTRVLKAVEQRHRWGLPEVGPLAAGQAREEARERARVWMPPGEREPELSLLRGAKLMETRLSLAEAGGWLRLVCASGWGGALDRR